MDNVNFTVVKNNVLKYGVYVIMIVLAFLLVLKRAEVEGLSLAVQQQKEKSSEAYKNSKVLLNQAYKLKEKGVKLKENVAILRRDSIQSAIKIRNLTASLNSKLSEIKQYKTNDIALYFQKRYENRKGVVITQYGVSLNDTIAKKNISELVTFDATKDELNIVKNDITKKNSIIKSQDEVIVNGEHQNNVLHLSLAEINKAFENSEATAKANEKIYKKEKLKKNFWKGVAGTVILGATYLIIFK